MVKRSYQSVVGEKTFDYFVVPRKDGEFPLGRYFHWIYFNVEKAKYDTLRSAASLEVRGEDYKLTNLSLSGSSGLYDNLENLDSGRETIDYKKILKDLTNIVIVVLLVTMIWVFRKLYEANTTGDFHRISNAVKLVMLAGILSMVFY